MVIGAWVTIAGLAGHGYTHGQEVRISGANPSGYDKTATIRVCPAGTAALCLNEANVFSYALTALPGPNTSAAVAASKKTMTATATSVNHGFATGSTVAIAGATPSGFNGNQTNTVVNANTFTPTTIAAE